MLFKLYIALVCYTPILNTIIPTTNFGPGIPDLDFQRILLYFFMLAMLYETGKVFKLSVSYKWLHILAFYTLLVIISVSWSNLQYNFSVIQELAISVFIPFLTALLALNLFRNNKNINIFLKHITVTAFILSIISIIQFFLLKPTSEEVIRATGTFNNPNGLAIFLILTIPSLLYSFEKKIMPKRYIYFVIGSVIVGTLFTVSRKGIITMFLTFFLFFFLKKQYKKLLAMGISMLLLIIIVASYTLITERFSIEKLIFDFNFRVCPKVV